MSDPQTYAAIRKRLFRPANGRHSDETEILPGSVWLREQAKKIDLEQKRLLREKWQAAIDAKIAADNAARRAATALAKSLEETAVKNLEIALATAGEKTIDIQVVPVAKIIEAVTAYFGISSNDLISIRKTKDLVTARHVVMYLAKNFTPRSYPQIGRHLGGRDHTTVMHGVERMTARLMREPELVNDVAKIMILLGLGSFVVSPCVSDTERGEGGD